MEGVIILSYIEANLTDGEEVIYRTKRHWLIFVSSLLAFLLCIIFFHIGTAYWLESVLCFLIGVIWVFYGFINFVSSEFVVINKGVLVKTGLIKRDTLETLLSKIECIQVQQGVLGRLFNYGTIVIVGTGGTQNTFKVVQKPLEFRKVVQKQISTLQAE
jgi:uncharacterized membrane protein YdbT with pleckstrin-like domain